MPPASEDSELPADRTAAIRAFYESHPYPAPVASLERRLDRYRDPQRRRAQNLLLWPLEKPRPDRRLLIAGCGTSQAARRALMEPEARVTAIDVSETSLRHTRDLQRKHDIGNLQLHQLAIERIGELGETFDQIVCTGVLHHLSDPDRGLRALRDVLARDGAIAGHGLRALRTRGRHYDAGLLPAAWDRRQGRRPARSWADGSSAADRPSDRRRRETGEGFRASPTRSPTRCSTPRSAPIPCRSFTTGSNGAASGSGAGTSRRLIFRSAGRSTARRMALALQRFPRPPNMRRSSSCAERWTGTASSPTGTTVNAKPSRSHSRATCGAASFRCGCRGRSRSRTGRPPASPPCSSIRATPIRISRFSSTPRRSGSLQ